MKKQLLSLSFLCVSAGLMAQADLKKMISTTQGISVYHTNFTASKPVIIDNAAAMFGLTASTKLTLKETMRDQNNAVHYRMQQTYDGIPVENAMYILHTQGGKLNAATGFIITDFTADMQARKQVKVTSADAVQIAIRNTHAETYMWQLKHDESELKSNPKDGVTNYYPKAEKVWYNSGDQLNPSALRLAYKVDIYSAKPFARAYYFIDAQTGVVLGKEDILNTSDAVGTATTVYVGNRTIHSDKISNGKYRLRDYSRGSGVITLTGGLFSSGKDYMSNSNNWSLTMPARNALDAHWGVEQTYDYYKQKFNRNSYDNQGSELKSYVNYWLFTLLPNASWDGNSMQYGQKLGSSQGVTAIDVTGHELTHGVTQSSSNLNYSGETGGMNEAMSDIFGKSVQFFARPDDINWQVGNEMNWIIRDMSNPNAFQQPDTYNGTYWKSNADVHVLSGVGNYFFYLLVNGGTGKNDLNNNYTVSAIGIDKAAAILYRTNTVYLTPTSKYADWRTACINAATDLYGAASNEVKQVKNAWYAVGIGSAAAMISAPTFSMNQYMMQPNPVPGNQSVIRFTVNTPGSISLQITDRNGKVLIQQAVGHYETGTFTYTITALDKLHTGSYYVVLSNNNQPQGRADMMVVH